MADAIRARRLTRRFGAFTAVDAVSFSVREGEIFGFLGPNGAGKTTTIKMLTGLLRPSDGGGRVAGVDLVRDPVDLRSRIGYMSQRFSLYDDLRVDENIALFAGLYGVAGERLEARRRWITKMAGLEGRGRRLTGELPLGYKQRLALGCAVLHEPPVLFLDEPTSGVDPVARRGFWDLIDGLAAGGTTVIVSTHYMEEAEHCHRLALMHLGRLIALGSPAELRREALRTGAPDEGSGAPDDGSRRADGDLQGADGGDRGSRRGMHRSRPPLEDVFISLVRRAGDTPRAADSARTGMEADAPDAPSTPKG